LPNRETATQMNITEDHLKSIVTNSNESLYDLSKKGPVMLVFLRHFGCIFCKESLYDISKRHAIIKDAGIQLVFVHMADRLEASSFFANYNIKDPIQVSDPLCKLYGLFGLVKGSFGQLFGLKTFIRGVEIVSTKQIMPGLLRIGDGFQMPGIFLIKNGNIVSSFIHNSVADKPNYEQFVEMCTIPNAT
jgi:peroxiredoxin